MWTHILFDDGGNNQRNKRCYCCRYNCCYDDVPSFSWFFRLLRYHFSTRSSVDTIPASFSSVRADTVSKSLSRSYSLLCVFSLSSALFSNLSIRWSCGQVLQSAKSVTPFYAGVTYVFAFSLSVTPFVVGSVNALNTDTITNTHTYGLHTACSNVSPSIGHVVISAPLRPKYARIGVFYCIFALIFSKQLLEKYIDFLKNATRNATRFTGGIYCIYIHAAFFNQSSIVQF